LVSLTGLPLLILSIVAAVGALVGTILLWSRGGRARLFTRTASILLCEALAVFAGAIAANRALDLYPSWSTFFAKAKPPPPAAKAVDAPPTVLNEYLAAHAQQGKQAGLALPWQPAGGAAWDLSGQPTLFLPPAYFTEATKSFPVIVVIAPSGSGPSQAGWDPQRVPALVGQASPSTPAILVLLRLDPPAPDAPLIAGLATGLEQDLRVGRYGWAAVGVGGDAMVALDLLRAQPGRYASAALVAGGTGQVPVAWVGAVRAIRPGQSALIVAATPPVQQGPPLAIDLVTPPELRLPDALRSTYPLLPPPLAAPVPGPAGAQVSSPPPQPPGSPNAGGPSGTPSTGPSGATGRGPRPLGRGV
jgi:hypothetical protein